MKQLAVRCCLLAFGIAAMAAGIVLITKTGLGTSPISSLGYVLSLTFPDVSYGAFMFCWNIALLIGQIAILRRRFKATALLQVPISVLFSIGIDAFGDLLSFAQPQSYLASLAMLTAGIATLAFGVACTVVANIVMNSGEAFVCAVTDATGWNFGRTKAGFDLGCVALASAASLLIMGDLVGVREGTVAAAAATGFLANAFIRTMGGARPALGGARERSSEAKPCPTARRKA
ncbi:hypothetical protein B5F40_05610 [Gordonibacter sp. An230]|uniref:YczE/YyaS/YitT family protein n=1 Tax=Gordonibacter sp. An230 TaxID=1965592 RepID=UPI000B3908AD|nr:DUF6198 family protein [Gordonibacter sp. An230]OUO90668.1 hypothetical protein B5F40_05610 [Gordonibacter sp. An230]